MEIEKITKLSYEISSFSSFSSSYLPENIRDDLPNSQTSRWSSDTNIPTQFITLKLKKPAIVKYIKFGKYEKSHVCNLKKFKIFGGLQESNMFQIYEGGLKNDYTPETFKLKHKMYSDEGERDIPILYVQIVPLLSYGPSFNFSIWYVELQGIEDVFEGLYFFNEQREKQAIRLILKHLRDKGYTKAFKELEREAKINLEDNQITELFQCLVEEGNFEKAEAIMEQFIENGDTEEYIANQKYKAKFSEIISLTDNELKPSNRADAGYAFDNEAKIVYMFGGHSDETSQDLNDFWQYSLHTNCWSMIHEDTSISPRCGQKMVFDPATKQIFMLGRKSGKSMELLNNYKNDFYLYDIQTRTWLLISEDVSQMNGPPLLYDHQMCLNPKDRTIYVFGGRAIKSDEMSELYSGFYTYHINTNTWNMLYLDVNHQLAANPEFHSIKARTMHAMMFDDTKKKIYVFGGQRMKDSCNDVMQFDVESNTFANTVQTTATTVASSAATTSLPSDHQHHHQANNIEKPFGLCFSASDVNKGEMYILNAMNDLWIYSTTTSEFSLIYKSSQHQRQQLQQMASNAFIVHNSCQTIYILKADSSVHFIQLQKPSRENVLNYCKYLIRKQKYEEITRFDPLSALKFLRNDLSEAIDKTDQNQLNDFHKLASLLFCENKTPIKSPSEDVEFDEQRVATTAAAEEEDAQGGAARKLRNQRSILFNRLTSLLPKSKRQPQQSLLNFINI